MTTCTDPAHAHTKRAVLLDRLRPSVPVEAWDAMVAELDALLMQMADRADLGSCA